MYALNIDKDGRILSATYEKFAHKGQPLVKELPEGDITNYIYTKSGYKYSPLEKEEVKEDNRGEKLEVLFNILLDKYGKEIDDELAKQTRAE